MRFVAVFLLGCLTAGSQPLSILPPSLNAADQRIFFGSSLEMFSDEKYPLKPGC
jgi:hypothetical protein